MTGTLKENEAHPMAPCAFLFVKDFIKEEGLDFFKLKEALASSALEANRLAEICGETLRRLLNGEPVSDRYLLGLAWFLKEYKENRDFFK